MFALLLAPFAALWSVDNSEFLQKMSSAEWEYVGVQERQNGAQKDGSAAMTVEVDGRSFILFKQRPLRSERRAWELADGTN